MAAVTQRRRTKAIRAEDLPGEPATAAWWGLNPEQERPFRDDYHTAVIACPGSGKTRMMVAKMARLIRKYGINQVMAVTFTTAAVAEMKERLGQAFGSAVGKQSQIGTFHKMAYRQIVAHRGRGLQVIKEFERRDIALRIRDRLASPMDNDTVMEVIDRYNRVLELHAPDPKLEPDAFHQFQVFQEYKKTVNGLGMIDMDDMVVECVRGYRSGDLKPYPLKALLVDEFQDSDTNQIEWLLAHAEKGTILTVVGDDDQSIYGFRHAMGVRAYARIRDRITPCPHLYKLQVNYRSVSQVLEPARRLVEHNQVRVSKMLQTHREPLGTFNIYGFSSILEEAQAIVKYFQVVGQEMAVLTRTKAWMPATEMEARANGCRVKMVEGGSFLEIGYVARVYSALRFGAFPDEKMSFLNAATAAGVHKSGLDKIEEHILAGVDGDETLLDILYRKDITDGLRKEDITAFKEVRSTLAGWVAYCAEQGSPVNPEEEAALDERIKTLCNWFAGFQNKIEKRTNIQLLGDILGGRIRGSIQHRLQVLDTPTDKKSENGEDAQDSLTVEEPGISILTMHSSKGLEFPVVWVAGCSDGQIPHYECMNDLEQIEEERRLLYVAMTRARDHLVLSAVEAPETPRAAALEVSRFVGEIEG